jgi:hypothetical protein
VVHAIALKNWCTDTDLLLALFREAWLMDREVAALLATDESAWQVRVIIRVLAGFASKSPWFAAIVKIQL